jgi:hypothetical protein
MLLLDHPDPKDHLAHPESPVCPDPLETQESQLKANHFNPENLDLLEMQDLLDLPVHLAHQDGMAHLVLRAPKVLLDLLDHQVPMVSLAHKGLLDLPGLKENVVFVRSTAPSTAEFSSKTERDDRVLTCQRPGELSQFLDCASIFLLICITVGLGISNVPASKDLRPTAHIVSIFLSFLSRPCL